MIASALLAAAAQLAAHAAAVPAQPIRIQQAARAIEAGRLTEARSIIAQQLASGAVGPKMERLLADLAYASGNYAEAFGRYRGLASGTKHDALLCERAGISAIRIDDLKDAAAMISCATADGKGTWRAWNARGVLADRSGDWGEADAAYAHAEKLAPDQAAIINNQGWSLLLRGQWGKAVERFQRAEELGSTSLRTTNNLELARAAISAELPRREPAESPSDYAKRLNDAGVAAELLGDKKRAIAAFSQALEASGTWYARAANNLDWVKSQ